MEHQTFDDFTGNWVARTQLIVPLFSRSISLWLKSLRFHLTEAPISDFLTHFPMDFNVGFLDRFRWRISCAVAIHCTGGLTCKERWSAELRRIFMTNNSPAAISNACYSAPSNNFDPSPFIQMTTINDILFSSSDTQHNPPSHSPKS